MIPAMEIKMAIWLRVPSLFLKVKRQLVPATTCVSVITKSERRYLEFLFRAYLRAAQKQSPEGLDWTVQPPETRVGVSTGVTVATVGHMMGLSSVIVRSPWKVLQTFRSQEHPSELPKLILQLSPLTSCLWTAVTLKSLRSGRLALTKERTFWNYWLPRSVQGWYPPTIGLLSIAISCEETTNKRKARRNALNIYIICTDYSTQIKQSACRSAKQQQNQQAHQKLLSQISLHISHFLKPSQSAPFLKFHPTPI